ncbi:hypothetical protein ACEZ3G_14330 [Maribacter algicola]|uniref:Uncharacterized protein n=1 Tax=Meishania litoralis TaxID=3434685 RepID=A0ACC7LSX5_9FLAO
MNPFIVYIGLSIKYINLKLVFYVTAEVKAVSLATPLHIENAKKLHLLISSITTPICGVNFVTAEGLAAPFPITIRIENQNPTKSKKQAIILLAFLFIRDRGGITFGFPLSSVLKTTKRNIRLLQKRSELHF